MFKLKKEVYYIGVMFIFVLGFFLGQNSNIVEIQNISEEKKEQDFATQNPDKSENSENKFYSVLEVIDGDTIKINYEGKKTSVRIIGINTPEKSGPYRETECFGEESSKKAQDILENKKVKIELDESQSKFDKYGRLLAYILVNGEDDFGLKMIKNGYAYENTYWGLEYKNQKIYKEAQKYAENLYLGLWSKNTCSGEK